MLDAQQILDEIRKRFPPQHGDDTFFPLCDDYGCQDRLEDFLLELEQRMAQKS